MTRMTMLPGRQDSSMLAWWWMRLAGKRGRGGEGGGRGVEVSRGVVSREAGVWVGLHL